MSSSEEVGYGPPGECVSMGKMATYHIDMAIRYHRENIAGDNLKYHLELAKKYIKDLNREGARFSSFVRSQPTDRKALATKIHRQRRRLRELQKLYTKVVDENNLIRAVLRRMPCEGCDMHIGTPYNMHTFCGNCAKKIVTDEQTT